MGHQLAARNELVNWQVAPAEHELSNYDKPKIKYRRYVEKLIRPLPLKSVRKKAFFTISTNVLCADIHSSSDTIDPIDRDIYLPLEITIAKWALTDAKKPTEGRVLDCKVWMINPGPPVRGCNCYSLEHKKAHKIVFTHKEEFPNECVEPDLSKAMKEINSFLGPDRVVFSLSLKYVRQDLGSLKWLNRESGYKSKPVSVYSLEDLYVVLIRHFKPDMGAFVGQGVARHRMETLSNAYDLTLQCIYHQAKAKTEDGECCYCAKALSQGWTNVLLDDVATFADIFADSTSQQAAKNQKPASPPPAEPLS